jgi:hypothetical protein
MPAEATLALDDHQRPRDKRRRDEGGAGAQAAARPAQRHRGEPSPLSVAPPPSVEPPGDGLGRIDESLISAATVHLSSVGSAHEVVPPAGGACAAVEVTVAAAQHAIRLWYAEYFQNEHTIVAFDSFQNLDKDETSGQFTVETGDQLSFIYTSSKGHKEYRMHRLEITVYDNGDCCVDQQSVETLIKKRDRSEGYWGLESCFEDDATDTAFHP